MVMKSFVYRIYPTKQQQALLARQLEECRWLWNYLLAERRQAWEDHRETIEYYDQKASLPLLKASERPSLRDVHSQVAQDVVLRLKKAFDAFFRRVKAGETPGYPRFRGKGRYSSLTYPQWQNGVCLNGEGTKLVLSKVGAVKLTLHRPLEGTPKTASLRRTTTGKWFVSISCEWTPKPLPPANRPLGIDMGLLVFATGSDGTKIPIPRFFRGEEHALAQAKRRFQIAADAHLAVCEALTTQTRVAHPELETKAIWALVSQDPRERKCWQERERRRQVVARIYERIRWRRVDFTQQHGRRLVDTYDLLVMEDLNIYPMVQVGWLAKSIHDAAWWKFRELVATKAAWAGRQFLLVNPAYTSQDCSNCGTRKSDLNLADRTYSCPSCGLSLDRDMNAARNILALGQQCLASA